MRSDQDFLRKEKKCLELSTIPKFYSFSLFFILAQEMIMPEVKIEDDRSLNECATENGTVAYVIEDAENALPLISNSTEQEDEQSQKKDEATSENASNQDEVDEEDLQEDELEELEEDEGEEDDIEEDEEEILADSCQNHPGLICRLCAQAVDTAHFIFTEEGREEKLLDKINTSLPVVVCDI